MKARQFTFALAFAANALIGLTTAAQAQSVLGAPLFAVLNGGNECTAAVPPLCRQGDPDGIGSATITFAPRDATTYWVCWGLTVDNLVGATFAISIAARRASMALL